MPSKMASSMGRRTGEGGRGSPSSPELEGGDGKPREGFKEQLEQSKARLSAVLERAGQKLAADVLPEMMPEAEETIIQESVTSGGLSQVLGWIGLATGELLGHLSEAHQAIARENIKAQASTFEMKLATSRTSAKVAQANAAAEMQAHMEMQIAAKIQAVTGDNGAEVHARARSNPAASPHAALTAPLSLAFANLILSTPSSSSSSSSSYSYSYSLPASRGDGEDRGVDQGAQHTQAQDGGH